MSMNVSFCIYSAIRVSGSGCKSRNPFWFLQALLKVFFRNFYFLFSFTACTNFQWTSALAGRKGNSLFSFRQAFREKNFIFFTNSLPSINLKNFAVIAGAKVRIFFACASFFFIFFWCFLYFSRNSLEGLLLEAEVFSSFPEASGILGCLGNAAAFVLPCKALKGICAGAVFFAGCLRNAGPGASRNAGRLLPQPRLAAASSCRRGSAGRLRQKAGIAWPGKRRAFRCMEIILYKEGFFGLLFWEFALGLLRK